LASAVAAVVGKSAAAVVSKTEGFAIDNGPCLLASEGRHTSRVAITGIGAVSGFGCGLAPLWTALLDGRRAFVDEPTFARAGLPSSPLALVAEVPRELLARASQLALVAAREAVADAGEGWRGARLGIACGTTLGDADTWLAAVRADAEKQAIWRWNGPALTLARELGAAGPVAAPSLACASGNMALALALDWIRAGRCDVVLAGGVDALNDFVLAGFASLKALDPSPCRPFDRARRGLNLGEGACMLVLEAETHARARSARIRAFLDGYGASADAVHMTGPDASGAGAARAMEAAFADARVDAEQIDFVSAHGTGTVFNDLMEAKALSRALGAHAATTPVQSVKSAIGHTLGAAAALEAALCVRVLESGLVPPTVGLVEIDPEIALDVVRQPRVVHSRVVLSSASGFGGTNVAIVLSAARGRR
jgi:3-oxoacyl-[acyl-carrier-protein] synthase II